jgi:Tfp pilus assembly protein PilZ
MPCAVHFGGRRYSGVVLNVSQGGLFVQTNADPVQGAAVDLELNAPESERSIPLQAKVVWRRVVPPQLRAVARGGMGVAIQRADESYYVLLARWMRSELPVTPVPQAAPAAAAPVAAAPAAAPSWRVRVRSNAGPRSRVLTIEAASAEDARDEALRHTGEGWRVIGVDPL